MPLVPGVLPVTRKLIAENNNFGKVTKASEPPNLFSVSSKIAKREKKAVYFNKLILPRILDAFLFF